MPAARRVRTKSFDHTISGLLTKRANLIGEAVAVRAQLTRLRSDLAALDHVLVSVGYAGDLSALKPRRKRETLFEIQATLGAMRAALEAQGIAFVNDGGTLGVLFKGRESAA